MFYPFRAFAENGIHDLHLKDGTILIFTIYSKLPLPSRSRRWQQSTHGGQPFVGHSHPPASTAALSDALHFQLRHERRSSGCY